MIRVLFFTLVNVLNYCVNSRMANLPAVRVIGESERPRYVFVIDRVAELVEEPIDVGMDSRDQILKFEDAKLANIEAFFEERKASYQNTSAVIFLQVGQDDISHDADKVLPKPLSATVEAYFKPDGPRQIPGDDFAAVAAAYEKLVSSTLQWLPWASFLVVSCSAAIAEWICHQTRHNRHEEDS